MSFFDRKTRTKVLVGRNNSILWYQDNNELQISYLELLQFISDYKISIHPYTEIQKLETILGTISTQEYISTKIPIKVLSNDLFAVLLVYLELPEMVEEILINQFKAEIRERGLYQDKIKQKLMKLR